ncbi:phosphatidate cytidylyltransferase [Amnibacterium kyonggiense]|uniref:Phosphatidate cytidylyltransferase n=1 Tax=Amnibacterium kyonggiense TaxID=595671 RepID=A0A4R7FSX0_9MICO|nr:phosphatidate cytidylyltransferase [Amnibacterium kyonggiense]TDS80975.1 phosphatidate cytidylyltransferase [Amnibacterium kyonggiense]
MSEGGPGDARPRRPRNTAELQDQIRSTRGDIRDQVRHTRAQFDEANARLTARSGRNLVGAVGLGVGLGALLIVSLVIWKPLFVLLAMALVGFGTSELAVAVRTAGIRVPRVGAAIGGVLAIPATYVSVLPAADQTGRLHSLPVPLVPGGWLAAIVFAVAFAVVWRLVEQLVSPVPGRALGRDVLVTTFVQLYVAGLGSTAVVLLSQQDGQWWTLSFVAVVVASDIFAYVAGLRFGRHPMAPRISPKKTWEGFAGAAVATVVLATALTPWLLDRPLWFGPVFGALILVTGTLGDLGESMIKRDIGVKDMSSWLPGHGGILDRLDSILPSAAAALLLFFATS